MPREAGTWRRCGRYSCVGVSHGVPAIEEHSELFIIPISPYEIKSDLLTVIILKYGRINLNISM